MSLPLKFPKYVQIFFLYSNCNKDRKLQEELQNHLIGMIEINVEMKWLNHEIKSEQDWENEVYKPLLAADIIVLLISSDFNSMIQSEPGWRKGVEFAIKCNKEKDVPVIPLLLRQVEGWQHFFKLENSQSLPKNGKFINQWTDRDEAFVEIYKGIEEIVNDIKTYQHHLYEYEQLLFDKIKGEYPLSKPVIAELKEISIGLKIKEKDRVYSYNKIIAQKEEEQRQKEDKYRENLQLYRKEFYQKAQWGNTLSPEARKRLELIRQDLGINEKDAALIEEQTYQEISQNPRKITIERKQTNIWGSVVASIISIILYLGYCSFSQKKQAENFVIQGHQKLQKRDYKGAIIYYNQAIRIYRYNPDTYNERGVAHYRLGDKEAASRDFTQAIDIAPDFDTAYANRGRTYYDLGKVKQAIEDYNEAIRIDSTNAYAYYYRCIALNTLGDKQTAIKDCQKAAHIYGQQKATDDYQKAVKMLNKVKGGK